MIARTDEELVRIVVGILNQCNEVTRVGCTAQDIADYINEECTNERRATIRGKLEGMTPGDKVRLRELALNPPKAVPEKAEPVKVEAVRAKIEKAEPEKTETVKETPLAKEKAPKKRYKKS